MCLWKRVALVGIECVVGGDMSLACSPEKSKKSKRTRRRKAKRRKYARTHALVKGSRMTGLVGRV